VPGDDSIGFNDDQGRSPVVPNLAYTRPEESIGRGQFGPLHRASQDAELVSESHVLQLECGSGFEDCRGRGCQNVKHMERGNGRFDEGRSNSMFSCGSGFTIDTIGSDSSNGRGRSALSFQEDVAAVICWQPLLHITNGHGQEFSGALGSWTNRIGARLWCGLAGWLD